VEYNGGNIRIEDIENLNLLDIQEVATIISLISDVLSYQAVQQSRELIYIKYTGIDAKEPIPDETVFQSVNLYILAKFLFTSVGFIRYNNLYNQSLEGDFDHSLTPNIEINIGNIFGLIGLMFLYNGAKGFIIRDANLLSFGVR